MCFMMLLISSEPYSTNHQSFQIDGNLDYILEANSNGSWIRLPLATYETPLPGYENLIRIGNVSLNLLVNDLTFFTVTSSLSFYSVFFPTSIFVLGWS